MVELQSHWSIESSNQISLTFVKDIGRALHSQNNGPFCVRCRSRQSRRPVVHETGRSRLEPAVVSSQRILCLQHDVWFTVGSRTV